MNPWRPKLTSELVLKIRQLCDEGNLTMDEIAELFGIGSATVWSVKNRRTWKSVLDKPKKEHPGGRLRIKRAVDRKRIHRRTEDKIRAMVDEGSKVNVEIAKILNSASKTVGPFNIS